MTVYQNPFLNRASEQARDVRTFVTSFGPGALDMLPTTLWDRLVVLRSSPGAGKTSLMRLFTAESVDWIRKTYNSTEPIYRELEERGVLQGGRLKRHGILLELDRNYRSLLDLPIDEARASRLFFRLLDVRVILGLLRSSLSLAAKRFPEDVGDLRLVPENGDPEVDLLVTHLGGPGGEGLFDYCRRTERGVLTALDALRNQDLGQDLEGHLNLYSPRVLSGTRVQISGITQEAEPFLMFDDGHTLSAAQRSALLDELRDRRTRIARWYSERFEALSQQELMSSVGREGRDYVLVDLDSVARHGSPDRRFLRGRYLRVLSDIAEKRAAPTLLQYAPENYEFMSLLDGQASGVTEEKWKTIVDALRQRVVALGGEEVRYRPWVDEADRRANLDAAVRWRELEALISRDQERQTGFFDEPLTIDEFQARSNSALSEAAKLDVSREFGLPYYGGREDALRLGSHNAEQFLNLCGDLFAELLVDVSLGRAPRLSLERQHRVIRAASERYWKAIPRTIPNGRDVQALVAEVVAIAESERGKPTIPYPPGVTGTGLLMGERHQLLDGGYRQHTPGADRLLSALAAACAHNVLRFDLGYSVKNQRYMVIYLNRLLCPRFWLPLGYGSFRERRLGVMTGWMRKLPAGGNHVEIDAQLALQDRLV